MTDAFHAPFPALRFHDEWRRQIHATLYDYARTYITRDAWTNMEETMNEIFASSLHTVPEYEMTSFHRPVDPLTDFLGRNQHNVPPQYEETFKSFQGVRTLLSKRLQPPNGRSKPTERCWLEEDSRPTYLDARPMTPILSTRSRRETQLLNRPRKPEVNTKNTIVPLKTLLTDQLGMEPPSMPEEPLMSDKILSTQLHLPEQILKDTTCLLQPNPWFSAAPVETNITKKELVSKLTSDFLRPTSPLPAAFDPKIRMSPPIFSMRISEKPREYLTRDEVHSMHTRAALDDDIDMDTENMAIVSAGWSTAPVEWSSTPPLKTDSSDITDDFLCELDELNVPMTPITNKRLKLLIENKMEEIELPKRERFRGRAKGKEAATGAPDLKTTLHDLVMPAPMPMASPPEEPPPLPRDTESIYGQPPTELLENQPTLRAAIPFDASVSNMLDAFCAGIDINDTNRVILDEKIDEIEAMLMPIPELPHPSIHDPILPAVPTKVTDLLIALIPDEQTSGIPSLALVVPAKGSKSLFIELNWRPFVYTGIPITHESLCRVDQPSLLSNVNEASKAPLLSDREVAQVEALLRVPDLDSPLPFYTALMDLFEVERSYHGGLSIDCPFEGDNILLMPRVSQQGRSSTTQKDSRPPQFALMDPGAPNEELVKNQSGPGPTVEDVPGDALQTNFLSRPMVRAGTMPAATMRMMGCPSRQDLSLMISSPVLIMDASGCSVDQSTRSETELWDSGGKRDIDCNVGLALGLIPPEGSLKTSLADFRALRALHGYPVGTAQPPSPVSNTVTPECITPSESNEEIFQESQAKDNWDVVLPLVSEDITLPDNWCEPSEDHYYLGSLDLIQRIGLVEHLRAHCRVHLVEAETLHGPDIILDSHSCAIFHPMASLYDTNTDICKSVVDLAKSFSRILVVLEAFPSSKAKYSAEPHQPYILNVLSNTVLRAFQKLVHKIRMASSMLDETEGADVKVDIVVARGTLEAAHYVRVYGNACEESEGRCFRGVLWGSRPWLQTEDGNELDIGAWPGMNTFASHLIASKMSLLDFIDLSLEAKLASFGLLVGSERMTKFHNACCARAAELSLPPSSQPLSSAGGLEPE